MQVGMEGWDARSSRGRWSRPARGQRRTATDSDSPREIHENRDGDDINASLPAGLTQHEAATKEGRASPGPCRSRPPPRQQREPRSPSSSACATAARQRLLSDPQRPAHNFGRGHRVVNRQKHRRCRAGPGMQGNPGWSLYNLGPRDRAADVRRLAATRGYLAFTEAASLAQLKPRRCLAQATRHAGRVLVRGACNQRPGRRTARASPSRGRRPLHFGRGRSAQDGSQHQVAMKPGRCFIALVSWDLAADFLGSGQ